MKHFRITLIAALLMLFAAAPEAAAQFRFGVQVGTNVNEIHFNTSTFDSNNRMGFNAGVLCEFTVPVSGVGLDFGLRYVRRNSQWQEQNQEFKDNRDYLEIPVNFKWKINIPVVNSLVRPFLTTGPCFSFLTSRTLKDTVRNRKFDTSWNFGAGLELFSKVQVAASYGIGMTKALEAVGITSTSDIHGRNRYWTVTAAYMF